MWFFGDLGSPSVILVNKSLKALSVSQLQNGASSSLPPFIVDLLTFKVSFKGPTHFFNGILEGVKWLTSQADYNRPKQQWKASAQ